MCSIGWKVWIAVWAAVAAAGLTVAVVTFSHEGRWFVCGLVALIVASIMGGTGFVGSRLRTLDEEYMAGYRLGYKSGRRVARPVVVVDLEERRAVLPQAGVRALASNR